MRHVTKIMVMCNALLLTLASHVPGQALSDPGQLGPYTAASVSITTTNPSTGSLLTTDIYYPSSGSGVDPQGAPHPALVFARGWNTTPSDYTDTGSHLATWGYIVAIPNFPSEDLATRALDVQYLLSYFVSETSNSGSMFFDRINTDRLGVAGHSLGGLTSMIVAARDSRVKVVVAQDPVNPPSFLGVGSWDYQSEAPVIAAPLVILGAPSQLCNYSANYNSLYPYVGSEHKAKYVFADASHCDFESTSQCYQVCLGGGQYDPARVELTRRYTVAWLNYYLQLGVDYYTYLYGAQSDADIQAGKITRDIQTATRGVTATVQSGAIRLSWTLSSYPIIAGYNIYRSQQSGNYSGTPYQQVGRQAIFTDTSISAGQMYYYKLRSRDTAGNEHQFSVEVYAQNHEPADKFFYLPLILKALTPQ